MAPFVAWWCSLVRAIDNRHVRQGIRRVVMDWNSPLSEFVEEVALRKTGHRRPLAQRHAIVKKQAQREVQFDVLGRESPFDLCWQ